MKNTTKSFPTIRQLLKSFGFLKKLTNQTGIIQHTKFGLPDRKNGYSLDDNARALIVALDWFILFKDKKALEAAEVYLAWLFHAKTDEGFFYNFSTFDNQFKDIFSEDGFGRAFWALGKAASVKSRKDINLTARNLINEISPNLKVILSPRAIAYCLLGLALLADAEPKNAEWKHSTEILATKLLTNYKNTKSKDWLWFENIIAYSNHILPLSLFEAYRMLKKKELLEVAVESLDFLESVSFLDQVPSPVGNHGWFVKGGERATFDQQPIEASEAILAHLSAFGVTKKEVYFEKALEWFYWYSGNNIKNLSLINPQNGGCFDSLSAQGVNENQGAESIIAYLMANLALLAQPTLARKGSLGNNKSNA